MSDADGGAPSAASLLLEGDASASGGARAALDISLVPAARLFPGQVVAVRGFNPTGGRLVARQIVTHIPPPRAAAGALPGAMDVDGAGGPGAVVAVAAGPFTTADDPAGYAPLDALLAALAARRAPPAMLVLLGPFVDAEQPAVASGAVEATFQSLFSQQVGARAAYCCDRACLLVVRLLARVSGTGVASLTVRPALPRPRPPTPIKTRTAHPIHPTATQVLAKLAAWQDRLPAPCQVVLVPSVRDAHALPTLPQPPLPVPGHLDAVSSLQNPALFDAGGAMTVGACSHDALRHLAGAELQRGPQADRMAALASHLLGQRR